MTEAGMFAIRDDRYVRPLALLSVQRGLSVLQRIYHPGRSHDGIGEAKKHESQSSNHCLRLWTLLTSCSRSETGVLCIDVPLVSWTCTVPLVTQISWRIDRSHQSNMWRKAIWSAALRLRASLTHTWYGNCGELHNLAGTRNTISGQRHGAP